jgi:predicted Zn-dependent protease
MNPTKTAQRGKKEASRPTPFEEIQALEVSEADRVHTELEGFAAAKEKEVQFLAKKEEKEEAKFREDAQKKLKECEDGECAKLLEEADEEAKESCTEIEQTWAKHNDSVVDDLVISLLTSSL